MQLFGFLYASSPRFFIGYWILQRGWVSTRPLLFPVANKALITTSLNSQFQIAIEVYIKDKYLK
jgi:hypothetical protein